MRLFNSSARRSRARGTLKMTFGIMIASTMVLSTFSYVFMNQKAYADGLTQENLPPASVGNRNAAIFVKVNPVILTSSSPQDAYIQFKLYDANNNQTIQHVTYHITVTRASAAGSSNATITKASTGGNATNVPGENGQKPLLDDFFHAHNGLLNLKVQPSNDSQVTIFGNKDPFQNAYIADPGGTVGVRGPLLVEGGLYHLQIEIFGIDNDRNIFAPESSPKFDSYLSVGDVSDEKIAYKGNNYNATIISYYDKIDDFKFNQAKKTLSWSMPFDWDPKRMKSVNIFVHEEVRLPMSMKGIADVKSFNAEVNGHPISGRMLMTVPTPNKDLVTIHYMLNKNDLLAMSQKIADGTDKMQFSLAPGTTVVPEFPMPATILTAFGALLGLLMVMTRLVKMK